MSGQIPGRGCTKIGDDGGSCLRAWRSDRDGCEGRRNTACLLLELLESWVSLTSYVYLSVAVTAKYTRYNHLGADPTDLHALMVANNHDRTNVYNVRIVPCDQIL